MRRVALLICALPLGALLAGWLLEKEQCVMWGIGNDVNIFSWQLTSKLVDNCSERRVVNFHCSVDKSCAGERQDPAQDAKQSCQIFGL